MLLDISMCHQNVVWVRSNLRESKFKIFLEGTCPQTSLVAMHVYAHYYHPATILFPPPQLKILYETLYMYTSIAITLAVMYVLTSCNT